MNTKSIIEIFRGDDSDALGYQTIVGTIHTDLDLTGCKAVFRYLGFFQEFDPIPEDGKLTIVIPSASSMQFPPGFGYASLKVYDIDRKVRTFTNRIPVFVKTMTPCRGGGEFDVEFSPFPELEPLKIFKGPNADDFDLYTGFISKIIDRASAQKYGLSMLFDAMDAEKTAEGGCAASPAAVKAAYDAIIGVLADNYYTAEQTDEAIDKLAAYYITSDTQGNPFATHAALVNATTYYSGGSVRIPTRNDYAIVVADETHNNEEWRYIYSENEQGVGQWEPQYAVEGVITFDDTVTRTSANGVKSSGIWSAIWGALSALPTGFTSLYDWCVAQIAKLRDKTDLNVYGYGNASVTFPDGFSITYDSETYTAPSGGESIEFYGPIESTSETGYYFWVPYEYKDDTDFNPVAQNVWCLTRDKYLGAGNPTLMLFATTSNYIISDWNATAPTLTLSTGEVTGGAPTMARPLGATGDTLAKVSQMNTALAGKANRAPNPTDGNLAALDSNGNPTDSGKTPYDFALTDIIADEWDFNSTYKVGDLCTSFDNDPSHMGTWLYKCILAPAPQQMMPPEVDTTHWTLATVEDVLAALRTAIAGKANTSDLNAKLDSTSAAPAFSSDSSTQYAVGSHCTYNGKLYKCTTATTGGTWVAGSWTADTMTDPDAVLDITAQNQLRVVAKDGTILWAQGYDLASTSSATLACDAANNFTFASGATSQAFTLPTAPTGKVGDFGLDIDNSANTGAATMTLTGLDSTFSVVVPEGESLNDMLAIAAGELARFYITLSTFRVNNLPTWHIVKQVVENGGAQS